MKKFSAIILVLILILTGLCSGVVGADSVDTTKYIKVTSANIVFRHKSNPSVELFNLVEGCYVKYIGESGDYYNVNYYGINGYVKKTDFNLVTNTPVTGVIHPDHQRVTVNVTSGDTLLRYPSEPIPSGTVVSAGTRLILVGTYTYNSELYLYVCIDHGTQAVTDSDLGAIKASNTSFDATRDLLKPDDYPFGNPSSGGNQTGGNQQNNQNTNTTTDPSNNLVRVLLIIGICIPAIIIVVLIFKPVKPSSARRASESQKRRRDQDLDDLDD